MGSQPLPPFSGCRQLRKTGEEPADDGSHVSLPGRIVAGLSRYVDSSDPLVRANNVLALMVASNQPFYPFYVRFVAGDDHGVSFLTLLSTPLFLALPMMARWRPTLALAGIPVLGLVNGMLAMKALGTVAGIDLFVIPCLLVALLVLHRDSWKVVVPAAACAVLAFWAQYFWQGSPLHAFTGQALHSLYRLNAFSVAGLTLFITYSFTRARLERARIRT